VPDVDAGDRPGAELHPDSAVQVRAVDRRSPGIELAQDVRMGVAVGVVGAHADEGDQRVRRCEEARGVRVAAVVRHLQHLGAEGRPVPQHEGLGEHLGIPREQHTAVGVVDAQDEGDLVQIGSHGTGPRG
jgi:sugar phosphate isomerase/epimerase